MLKYPTKVSDMKTVQLYCLFHIKSVSAACVLWGPPRYKPLCTILGAAAYPQRVLPTFLFRQVAARRSSSEALLRITRHMDTPCSQLNLKCTILRVPAVTSLLCAQWKLNRRQAVLLPYGQYPTNIHLLIFLPLTVVEEQLYKPMKLSLYTCIM